MSKIVKQDYKIVNAKYKLNTSEIKFIMSALSQIHKDDTELKEYEIKVSDLSREFEAEQNHTRLKQWAKKLMSKPLEVPTEDGFIVFNWFADIEYKNKEGKFIVSFSKKLKPYLLELKERFVKYNFENIINLSSQYSIKIYQYLKEYETITKRYFEVEELMELLQVPKSLKTYSNFKLKVLTVAEEEINKYTDINISYEEEKNGKKVARIIFRIRKKDKQVITNDKNLFDNQVELIQNRFEKYYSKKIYGDRILSIGELSNGLLKVILEGDGTRPNKELRFTNEEELKFFLNNNC